MRKFVTKIASRQNSVNQYFGIQIHICFVWRTWCLFGILGVLFGVLGVLFGVPGVLFSVLGILFGIPDVLFGVPDVLFGVSDVLVGVLGVFFGVLGLLLAYLVFVWRTLHIFGVIDVCGIVMLYLLHL